VSAIDSACASVRSRFDDYVRDALEPAVRRGVREHLSLCDECRRAGAAADPTLLFARPLGRDASSPDETQSILRSVRTGVSLMQAERRIGAAGGPGGAGAAWPPPQDRRRRISFAAAAVLALLTLLVRGGSAPRPSAEMTADREVSSALAAPPETILPSEVGSAGEIEPARSDATVYDWNPGAGREEPRVVWIVDRGLDI
jgi:hypothetical protein